MILNNPNLPQHNQGAIEKFIEEDIPSKKPYFCFLKKNNGELHILSNISSEEHIKLIKKEFINCINKYFKERNKK